MPTATSFAWTFPWNEMLGGFNAFITMFNTPVAIAGGLALAIGVVSFAVAMIRRARS